MPSIRSLSVAAAIGLGAALAVPGSCLAAGKIKPYSFKDCEEAPKARLEAAVDKAVEKVQGCLKGLNSGIAGKIVRKLKRKKIHFVCGDQGGTEGGRVEFYQNGAADVIMSMQRKRGIISYPLEQRVFHELIHAVDPQGNLLLSAKAHARAGFPDPVYGCQFACYPEAVGTDEMDRLYNYQRHNSLVIPEDKSYSCDEEGTGKHECATLRKHAHLCRTGEPYATRSMKDEAKLKELPGCLIEKCLNECGARVCKKLVKGVSDVMEANGGAIPRSWREKLLSMGQNIAAVLITEDRAKKREYLSSLNEDETKLYRVIRRKRYYQACMK